MRPPRVRSGPPSWSVTVYRRLPVLDGGELQAGIVTLDDIAVRTGNLEVAQRMTQDVIQGALPEFFFHERG